MTNEEMELLKARRVGNYALYEEFSCYGRAEAAQRCLCKARTDARILNKMTEGSAGGSEDRELAELIQEAGELWEKAYRTEDKEMSDWYLSSWSELVEVVELCYHYDIVSRQYLDS